MRRFLVLLAVAPLAVVQPTLAGAQTADPRDVVALETCVADVARSNPFEATVAECTGALSATCGAEMSTTNAIAGCIMDEGRAWDALLNRWWEPMKASAQAAGTWDTLLGQQRRWIAEKEAACQRAYDRAGGGSIRVIYGAECFRDWTARKAVEFYYALYR
ncbi:lysozyme inhibitor LprI family protein [Roseivivax isoporae]|uniref:Lysozyme inhibitor LprI-like N-terminal domain-containing protein n=1 Tax=Roseivivax isoporae LMG 25204 TaxID=1449351 RepID=X7F9I6_9RHOB|nr:lysozyme inhibitor LprI family protein [Roseivivax isoporae]ETX29460.1 hypothetical protein RISW2_23275 [Roseivivax isoporae LMG 25204]